MIIARKIIYKNQPPSELEYTISQEQQPAAGEGKHDNKSVCPAVEETYKYTYSSFPLPPSLSLSLSLPRRSYGGIIINVVT